jgi:hypothetical protein
MLYMGGRGTLARWAREEREGKPAAMEKIKVRLLCRWDYCLQSLLLEDRVDHLSHAPY